MSWIKILLGFAIIAFCMLLGYIAAGKYRSRKLFFTQLFSFHERYLNELSYSRKPLSQFISEYSYAKEFGKTVEDYQTNRIPKLDYPFLKKDERVYLADYFAMLGTSDARSQNGYFSAQTGSINEKKAESEKEAKTRGELYLKLGLLAGLAFVILII